MVTKTNRYTLIIALVCCWTVLHLRGAGAAPEITGGQEADLGEWPWQTLLVNHSSGSASYYNDIRCGGTLIAPRWVMTAAHCVVGITPDSIDAVAGIHDTTAPESTQQRRPVTRIFIHPNNNGIDFDFALVELASAILPNSAIQYAALPPSLSGSFAGVNGFVTGWGATYPANVTQLSPRLQELEVPIWSNSDCVVAAQEANPNAIVTSNMICAGGDPQGGKDGCNGDSGGPLQVKAGQQWLVIGVVSWGFACGLPNVPGGYARVSFFADWINQTIASATMNKIYMPLVLSDPSDVLVIP